MKRLTLTEWAAVGELIATIAVVISLLFVVVSIRQNTSAVQGSNENLVFEKHLELTNLFVTDESLAAIYAKKRSGDAPLTELEAIRWERYTLNLLDVWALSYHRYREDLLNDVQWTAWDGYFSRIFCCQAEKLSFERWEELQYGFDPGFWGHVRETLYEK